jgi:cytidylate kinase
MGLGLRSYGDDGMSEFAHVAIDGPAGSGKTTVARALSRRLGILNLDTGAMYRALALAALQSGVPVDDEAAIMRLAQARPIDVALDPESPEGFVISIGGTEVGEALYRNEVSTIVSIVAAYPGVRRLMVERQRAIAQTGSVVMAGRDIGTVVLPDAPVKIYLTASLEARVDRRLAELAQQGTIVDPAELRAQMIERDELDAHRTASPLRPADDAITIDSTHLSVDEVVARVARAIEAATTAH